MRNLFRALILLGLVLAVFGIIQYRAHAQVSPGGAISGTSSRLKVNSLGVNVAAPAGNGNVTATGTITAGAFVGSGTGLTGLASFPYSRTNATATPTYQLATTNNTGAPTAGMELSGNGSHASFTLRDTVSAVNQRNANIRYTSNLMRFGVCDDNYNGCMHFMQAEVSGQQEFDDLLLHVRSGAQIRLGQNATPNDIKVVDTFHVDSSAGVLKFDVGASTTTIAQAITQTGGGAVNFSGNVVAQNAVNTNRIQPFSGSTFQVRGNTIDLNDSTGGNTATISANGSDICTTATGCPGPSGSTKFAAATINQAANSILRQVGVTSASHPGTGSTLVNITAAGFTGTPSCTGSHSNAGSRGTNQVYATSATSMQVDSQDASGTAADTIISLVCVGT